MKYSPIQAKKIVDHLWNSSKEKAKEEPTLKGNYAFISGIFCAKIEFFLQDSEQYIHQHNLNLMTIINNTDVILDPSTQQVIKNAMANYGTDKVQVAKRPIGGADGTLFDIYNLESDEPEYIATIDTEGDVLSDMR